MPVAPELIAELDRRMEACRKDPAQVTTWEAVEARPLDERGMSYLALLPA